VVYAEDFLKFVRGCEVFSKPNPNSKIICAKNKGNPILSFKEVSPNFLQIQSANCTGFVFRDCLNTSREPYANSKRKPASYKKSQWGIGITGMFDAPTAKAPVNDTLSKGLGYGIGLNLDYMVSPSVKIIFEPTFQYMRLGRAVDGSGSLANPSPVNVDQGVRYFGTGLLLGWNFASFGYSEKSHLYLEGGGQFLLPLSATQIDSNGDQRTFKADKLLLLQLGPSFEYAVSGNSSVLFGARFFYHLTAKDATRLYGGRLVLALSYRM
jgi:hypothetical protein